MRTYKRKRPDYQVIEGVEGLCRLCLGQADAAVPIFTDGSDGVCAVLSLRIMICVGLEIVREDCLPNTICKDCFKELEHYYSFRKKCEVTYQKLKMHVLAVKERDHKKALELKMAECGAVVVAQESVDEPQAQLLLTINKEQQVEFIDVKNFDSVQSHELTTLTKIDKKADIKQQISEEQMQDITTSNSEVSTIEIQATTSNMSLIMSTMLIEFGVLRQEEHGLVLVDESLRTVELEGEDDSKIVLQLVEEAGMKHEIPETESPILPASPSPHFLKETKDDDILPIPRDPASFNDKDITDKKKASWPTCEACGKRFATRSVLARHERGVHSGERPYACRVCARRFAQRVVLKRHELVHKESRPFKCSQCPRSYTQRGALEVHARRHTPAIVLHRCTECDKTFLYASGLSRHMAVHQGRVWACGACSRLFRDHSALRRHAARAHAPPPPAPKPAPVAPKPANDAPD